MALLVHQIADRYSTICNIHVCRDILSAMNCQLVVNPSGYIIYYLLGWPGSVHDNNEFQKTRLHQSPNNFFNDREVILGDSAYTLSAQLLTLYKGRNLAQPDNLKFNKQISAVRVSIGILKN